MRGGVGRDTCVVARVLDILLFERVYFFSASEIFSWSRWDVVRLGGEILCDVKRLYLLLARYFVVCKRLEVGGWSRRVVTIERCGAVEY